MTILKVGFAMGGGIALGTFNGAVLGEVIKLALLRGKDKHNKPYDAVEIDVFSGASAGSMSLALMLRALVYQTDSQRRKAEEKLVAQFGSEFNNITDEDRRLDLIAAQVLQDVQYQAWVKDVTMDRLLEKNNKVKAKKRLQNTAGILNRYVVDEIARKHIHFDKKLLVNDPHFSRRRLLADRVLYASALTNLTPIISDARDELPAVDGAQAVLVDAMTSKTHRELRVFDLYFGEHQTDFYADETKHPSRWIRYHVGNHTDGTVGNLSRPDGEAWAKIAATAVASGAFPFAFEPVVLSRRDYEYGDRLWPVELSDKNQKQANFTYTDGGTFNNEPLREAFRMASFIDSHDDRENTDRWVVFVDPHVSDIQTSFQVPVHQRFNLEEPTFGNMDGFDLDVKHSLDRLIPQAFSILNSITNQARSIEGDKVYQVNKKFKLRDELRPLICASLEKKPGREMLKLLLDKISSTLETNRLCSMVPAGALTIQGELKRIISEVQELKPLKGYVDEFLTNFNKTSAGVDDTAIDNAAIDNAALWHQALGLIMLDLTLDLSGKTERAKLVSIGPIKNPSADTSIKPERISLPGEKLGAFGGFTFEHARHVDTEIGKWCAEKFLSTAGLITASTDDQILPRMSCEQSTEYKEALKQGTEKLVNRLFTMISKSHIPVFQFIPKAVLSLLFKSRVMQALDKPDQGTRYEFRIKVPDEQHNKFEWDGPGKLYGDQDIAPLKLDGGYYLITFANFLDGKWKGAHVSDGTLKVAKDGFFVDSEFCKIRLPEDDMIKNAGLLGYPVFFTKVSLDDEDAVIPANSWALSNQAEPTYQEFLN